MPHAVALIVFCCLLFCANAADLQVFDEDDPLGRDYYDASVGHASPPSTLNLRATSRDKMPVITNTAASGRFSGVIDWNSLAGGDWLLRIFAPGFPLLNTSGQETLALALNGPEPIPAALLPGIELEDVRGRTITNSVALLITGLDADAGSWQQALLPLADFKGHPEFERSRVKHITFHQSATDGQPHTLWVDNIHFSSGAVTTDKARPPIPTGLMARPGDRSVTLHWQALPGTRIQYRIYRKNEGSDAYSEVPGSPVRITSFADNRVSNGTSYQFVIRAENEAGLSPASHVVTVVPKPFTSDDDFLEYVQACAFDYFWFEANQTNGMIRDRSQPWSAASIAAMGFGLTAIGIGIDHQWITRSEGAERVLRTLETLGSAPQGPEESGTAGYKGWFYHFLDSETATRFGTSELSSIDSALLFAGVLYAAEFFDNDSPSEQTIRSLAKKILNRVDWRWMLNNEDTLAMGWYPERGFTSARWTGYNEASILYLLGLGSEKPGGALNPEHWSAWTRTYSWNTSHGFTFIPFPPLFGHQYTACWVDFRDIADDFGRAKGITYFENSRRATLAQRAYCIENPQRFPGYGADVWGLTACDGPGSNQAHAYIARGAPPAENDDGTIAPTAAGGSLPFAPAECVRALRTMYDRYREQIWCGYGFRDAFNLQELWWGEDVIGIDQGPILIMAENLRTARVWEIMKKSSVLDRGLKRAGFRPIQGETPRQK